ncbi:hypothetical protein HDV01_007089 [Terramyces sp. JEL0728]|nr:hypothetical protein HDV01_007089 [Terramyces sp. JEL0728]
MPRIPVELLHEVVEYMDTGSLLNLSLTSKFYFRYLAIFGRIANAINPSHLNQIWPSLELSSKTLKQSYLSNLEKMVEIISNCPFKFPQISITSLIFKALDKHLPPSHELKLIIGNDSKAEELGTAHSQNNLTIVEFTAVNLQNFNFMLGCQNIRSLSFTACFTFNFDLLVDKLINSSVEELNFERNFDFNSDGIDKVLSVLGETKLKRLSMKNFFIGSESIHVLTQSLPSSKLEYLDLGENSITDDDTVEISRILPLTELKVLKLDRNNISKVGYEALTKGLVNSKITILHIYDNEIETFDLEYFMAENLADTQIEEVTVSTFDERLYHSLTENISRSNVKTLNLSIPACFLQPVLKSARYSTLQTLVISGRDIEFGDASVTILSQYLKDLPIKELALKTCYVGSSGIRALFKNLEQSKVERLVTSALPESVDEFENIGEYLANCNLRHLGISSSTWTDGILEKIAAGVNKSKLQSIDLSSNSFITYDGILQFVSDTKESNLVSIDLTFIVADYNLRKKLGKEIHSIREDGRLRVYL